MSKTSIYYFSATGNSLKVAKELCNEIGECELIPIVKAIKDKNHKITNTKVGIVFPLFYAGIPSLVKDFITKTDFSNTSYIWGVTTPGATKYGAIYKLNKLLKSKGTILNCGFYTLMPDNFTLMLKIPSKEKQEKMFSNLKKRISYIANNIKEEKNITEDNFVLNQISRVVEALFTIGLKNKDKHFHSTDECTNCAICQKICPVNNITMEDGKPMWNHNCETCLACIHACPHNAIHWKNKTQKKGQYRHPEIKLKELIIGE